MNLRTLNFVLCAAAAFSLAACVVETSGSTSTGAGGGTGTGGNTTVTGTGGDATGSGGATSTGTSMCDPTYACADAITSPGGNPALLCDGPAKALFDALATCTCAGACEAACGTSACADQDPSTDCKTCLSNSATGCGKDFNACLNGG